VRSIRFVLSLLALATPIVAHAGPQEASQLDEGIFAVKQPGNSVPTAYVSSHVVPGSGSTPPVAHEHWWVRVASGTTWSNTAASWEFSYLGTPMAEGTRPTLITDAGNWREYLVTYHTSATGTTTNCPSTDTHAHRKCGLYTVTQPPATATSHHLGFNLDATARHQHWFLDTATWLKPSRTNCLVTFSFGTAATIPASAETWVPSGGPYQSMKTTIVPQTMSPSGTTDQSGC